MSSVQDAAILSAQNNTGAAAAAVKTTASGLPRGHRAPPRPPAKRGRKVDESLPPSRSREIQRAFRARKAALLDTLQQRVKELEAENDALRARLGEGPRVEMKNESGDEEAENGSEAEGDGSEGGGGFDSREASMETSEAGERAAKTEVGVGCCSGAVKQEGTETPPVADAPVDKVDPAGKQVRRGSSRKPSVSSQASLESPHQQSVASPSQNSPHEHKLDPRQLQQQSRPSFQFHSPAVSQSPHLQHISTGQQQQAQQHSPSHMMPPSPLQGSPLGMDWAGAQPPPHTPFAFKSSPPISAPPNIYPGFPHPPPTHQQLWEAGYPVPFPPSRSAPPGPTPALHFPPPYTQPPDDEAYNPNYPAPSPYWNNNRSPLSAATASPAPTLPPAVMPTPAELEFLSLFCAIPSTELGHPTPYLIFALTLLRGLPITGNGRSRRLSNNLSQTHRAPPLDPSCCEGVISCSFQGATAASPRTPASTLTPRFDTPYVACLTAWNLVSEIAVAPDELASLLISQEDGVLCDEAGDGVVVAEVAIEKVREAAGLLRLPSDF